MELLFPLLLVALLVPMFLGVRRQKREAQKVAEMQEGIKVGDRVTTTSGLYGTVVDVDDTTIDLEIAEDVVTTWLRAAVRDVRADETETTSTTESADATEEAADATDAAEPSAAEAEPAKPAVDEPVENTSTKLGKD
ncbi:preprotein translocase subunit YajC [Nocardia mexicana]|uniref:Preprotein translocase subunit YajC n=1 Tax=Nocardia mexicana TaxID=279262 RepID=A0A370H311_9NOCA|nr:preprotein translocase subunit YajC [Nocardia mexicana]RDI50596.1 preprotein translocase subunit YajC [Nocardia mexicana]